MKTRIIYKFNVVLVLIILLLSSIMLVPISFAAPIDETLIQQQQLILQQQQEQQRQRELNWQQINEAERIRRTRIGIEGGLDSSDIEVKDIINGDSCNVEFKKIRVKGNKIYSAEYLKKKVLGKYLKRCINKNNIAALQNDLMKFYIDHGYSNARIYFDFSNAEEVKNGVFDIVIEEGKVRNIEIIDIKYNNKLNEKIKKAEEKGEKSGDIARIQESSFHKFRTKSQTFFAFPFLKGKEFNLRDYEQGLDQINRLQSNNATIDIRAVEDENKNNQNNKKIQESNKLFQDGNTNIDNIKDKANTAGYSDIYIINNNSFPISLNIGADNSGNKSTGERNAFIGVNIDNLISVDDNIYLKYTQDLDSENSKRYNKAFYSSLSVPFGYWTFSSSLNYSKYLTTVNALSTSFHTSGNTLTQTYNIDRVLFRRQLYKINAGTELTVRDTESWIRDLKSETGTRKSSNLNFYINNIIYTKLGTIIIKPSYQKGLEWFNSKEDENDLLKNEARNQYDLIKLYAYYNTKINLPLFTKTEVKNKDGTIMMQSVPQKDKDNNQVIKQESVKVRNKIPLNYTLTFDSQYSWHTLYGTDQFSIGGEWTVRGFRNNTISGDNGYNIRNDLRVNLIDLFPNFIVNSKPMNLGNRINNQTYNISINDALSRTYLSLFYDYGFVMDKYGDSSDTEYNSKSGYMSGTGVALNYYGKYLNWSLTYAKALQSPQYLQSRDGIKEEGHSLYWRVGGRF